MKRPLHRICCGLALLIAGASCTQRSTDATGPSTPSGSADAAPPPIAAASASAAAAAAEPAEDRKRAAILWLRYAERTIPVKAPDRWGDLSLTCARLGYPLDAEYGKAALARAEALFEKSSSSVPFVDLMAERVRQGRLEEVKKLAGEQKTYTGESEDRAGLLGAFQLLMGDQRAAEALTIAHAYRHEDWRVKAYDELLSFIVDVGRSDLALPLLDRLDSLGKKRWFLAKLARRLASMQDRARLQEVVKHFDAAPYDHEVPAHVAIPEKDRPWWHARQLEADAWVIDALARVGDTVEAHKRIGDATRFWIEFAPTSLPAADVARMLARDRGRVGNPGFHACQAARPFARFDPPVGLELLAEGRKLDADGQCLSLGDAVDTLAIADQSALIAFWDTVDWKKNRDSNGVEALIDAVTRPDRPLNRAALTEIEARLAR